MREHDGGVEGCGGCVKETPPSLRDTSPASGEEKKEPGLNISLDIIPMIGDMHSVSSPRGSGHDGDLGGRR